MKKVELIVKQDLFDKIGVTIGQLHYNIDKNNDFSLCGSVSSDSKKLEGYSLYLRANLCDEEGGILYVNKSYSGISFEMVNYDAFSITCSDLTRFFDIDKLHHIEIYPNVRKASDED